MNTASLTLHGAPAPFDHVLSIPGSKSFTNRALVIASLADGTSEIIDGSPSDDSRLLIAAQRLLGVELEESPTALRVRGRGGSFSPYQGSIDVGPAGTTMRFLTALCAAVPGTVVELRGSERMHERPIDDLVNALRQLGADIEYLGRDGCPPLRIRGSTLKGRAIEVDGSLSSQFLSALLLVSPLFDGTTGIKVTGERVSESYAAMTVDTMRQFGVEVEAKSGTYIVQGGQHYKARSFRVEPDASGASYFWALAAVRGGRIRIEGVRHDSIQGDMRFPDLLEQMGCFVARGHGAAGDWIEVAREPEKGLAGINTDMTLLPDTAQTLAAVAACAKGETVITGLRTLRVKETDRIAALHDELDRMGIASVALAESIMITGGTPKPARIKTYKDHRMAMAFGVLGAVVPGLEIEEPGVVEKSFPTFWEELARAGVKVVPGGAA